MHWDLFYWLQRTLCNQRVPWWRYFVARTRCLLPYTHARSHVSWLCILSVLCVLCVVDLLTHVCNTHTRSFFLLLNFRSTHRDGDHVSGFSVKKSYLNMISRNFLFDQEITLWLRNSEILFDQETFSSTQPCQAKGQLKDQTTSLSKLIHWH